MEEELMRIAAAIIVSLVLQLFSLFMGFRLVGPGDFLEEQFYEPATAEYKFGHWMKRNPSDPKVLIGMGVGFAIIVYALMKVFGI